MKKPLKLFDFIEQSQLSEILQVKAIYLILQSQMRFNLNKYLKYIVIKAIIINFSIFQIHEIKARSFDFFFMNTTMHIEPFLGIDLDNASKMPYRLDEGAVFIFTPGIGIIYDSRPDNNKYGWSFIYGTHLNLNCYGTYMIGAGAGARYKYFITQKINFNVSLMIETLIMTRQFLPVQAFDNQHLINLAYFLMHDLPGTEHKIIFPTPMLSLGIAYELKPETNLSFNIIWSGVSIGIFMGVSIPAGNLIDQLKKMNPPKYRTIINSNNYINNKL